MPFKNLTNEHLESLVELYTKVHTEYGEFEKQILSGEVESAKLTKPIIIKCKLIFEHIPSCPECKELVKIIKTIIAKNKKLESFINEHTLYSPTEIKANETFLGSLMANSLSLDDDDRMAIIDILDEEFEKIRDVFFTHFHIFERHIS